MSDFDHGFESDRLTMLAKQYPEIVKLAGEVIFCAEVGEDRLSLSTWRLEDEVFYEASDTGFKFHLCELLDNFIEYRGLCNELPKKEGVVRLGNGEMSIEWFPDGSTHLSKKKEK